MPINVERRTKKLCWTENLPGAVDAAVSQEVADGIADRGIVDVGGRAKVSNAKLQKRWSEQQKKKRQVMSNRSFGPVRCAGV